MLKSIFIVIIIIIIVYYHYHHRVFFILFSRPLLYLCYFLARIRKQVRSTVKLPHVTIKFDTLLDSLRTGLF
jgi:hypothetical protein